MATPQLHHVSGRDLVRWTFDLAAPFEVFDRVPPSISTEWLLPALYAALAVLVLSFLRLPVAAVARRTYHVPHPLTGSVRRASTALAIMAGVVAALLATWAYVTVSALGSPDQLAGEKDGLFMGLQIASAFLLPGLAGVAVWNMWLTWRGRLAVLRRIWSVLVALSALLLLYVALRFNLMAMTVNY